MSQEFMDPEIFSDFILEAREHLDTIEPNLLELEKNPDNLSLLDDIFRPMHSLKGASGFLGLGSINKLAHKAESLMDELRKGNMRVNSDIMDLILSATDMLRGMIENLEERGAEGDFDVNTVIDRMEDVLAGGGTPTAEPAVEPEPVSEQEEIEELAPEAAQESAGLTAEQETPVEELELIDRPAYELTSMGPEHMADFLEEARELIESLNASLLDLEKDPSSEELVNDIFRYFHNLKGNSGIIGYAELADLCHEAETLLNRARKKEMEVSRQMVDLLLNVADFIEVLVNRIDKDSGRVVPVEISALVSRLQKGIQTGEVEPLSSRAAPPKAPEAQAEPAVESVYDPEDAAVFEQTVTQQLSNMGIAMDGLRKDPSNRDFIDALYRSFTSLQNSASYMQLDELKVYAERTANLVDQGRKADTGFEAFLDILDQEIEILRDSVQKNLEAVKAAISGDVQESAQTAPSEEPAGEESLARYVEEMNRALKALHKDSSDKEQADSLYEFINRVGAAADRKGLDELQVYAERTANLVDQGRGAGMELFLDILDQEIEILGEMALKAEAPGAKQKAEPEKEAEPVSAKPAKPAEPAKAKPAKPEKKPAPAADTHKPKVSSTIRVEYDKLDSLMNLIGELIINRNRFVMLTRSLEAGRDAQELAQQFSETTDSMARISDDLQDTIMNVRMIPVQTVFSRFPRLVRDLSRKSGKKVELITEGEETELDKSVIEVIGDPLVHLIRNSVDHGLESEEERAKTGKPEVGKVWLRAYHKGNSVAIEVEDDGKGIDPDKMRQVGVKKGLCSEEEARSMDDREAIELIFAPGFSAAEKVTDISGRGVGMDVVRTNIKNLKGSVSVNTELGKGTKFTMTLPLTLAIIDALIVEIGGETFAIPLDAVSETTKIEADRLTDIESRKAVTLRGEVLGIVELAEVLGMVADQNQKEVLPIVVIVDNDRRLGLVVDKLLERQEIVIKPLGDYLGDREGISGATIMGDGSVVLILDPHEIYSLATARTSR